MTVAKVIVSESLLCDANICKHFIMKQNCLYLNIAIHLNLNGVSVVHASLNPRSCCILNIGKAIQLQFYPVGLPVFHQCQALVSGIVVHWLK